MLTQVIEDKCSHILEVGILHSSPGESYTAGVFQVSVWRRGAKTLVGRKQKTVCHCPGRRPCAWPPPPSSRRPDSWLAHFIRHHFFSSWLIICALKSDVALCLLALYFLFLKSFSQVFFCSAGFFWNRWMKFMIHMIDLKRISDETRPGTWKEKIYDYIKFKLKLIL